MKREIAIPHCELSARTLPMNKQQQHQDIFNHQSTSTICNSSNNNLQEEKENCKLNPARKKQYTFGVLCFTSTFNYLIFCSARAGQLPAKAIFQ